MLSALKNCCFLSEYVTFRPSSLVEATVSTLVLGTSGIVGLGLKGIAPSNRRSVFVDCEALSGAILKPTWVMYLSVFRDRAEAAMVATPLKQKKEKMGWGKLRRY
jgi:hypothetical protein